MDTIDENISRLLESIKKSGIYQEYRIQEETLNSNPELRDRVMAFRGNNYRLQNECDENELLDIVDRIARESQELRSLPEVNAYLDAELALCKMMQRICRKLTDGIDMITPDV